MLTDTDRAEDVRQVRWAWYDEEERWFIRSRDGRDEICRRGDGEDDDEAEVVSQHPEGDGGMHLCDLRAEACARAVLTALKSQEQ